MANLLYRIVVSLSVGGVRSRGPCIVEFGCYYKCVENFFAVKTAKMILVGYNLIETGHYQTLRYFRGSRCRWVTHMYKLSCLVSQTGVRRALSLCDLFLCCDVY